MASPTSLYDLLDVQVYPTIADNILERCGPREIIRLSRTCKTFLDLYKGHLLRTQWNVDRRLRQFVKDPLGLRAALGRFDALIAGGFATQYFDRSLWPASDLDIFAEVGDKVDSMRKYLIEREGYEDVDGHQGQAYDNDVREFLGVRSLQKEIGQQTRKIQVVSMKRDPLIGILRDFYSNVVSNIITSTKAYCIYPRPTFVDRKAYYLKVPTTYVQHLMKKYEDRGWDGQISWEQPGRPDDSSFAYRRRVGGRLSWIITFDNSAIPAPNTPDLVRDYACFGVTATDPTSDELDEPNLGSQVFPFYACPLQYKYVGEDDHTEGPTFWQRFLGPYMDWLTYQRFRMMPKDARPTRFNDKLERGSPTGFTWGSQRLPDEQSMYYYVTPSWTPGPEWRYIDDKVPILYEEFEKILPRLPNYVEDDKKVLTEDFYTQLHVRLGSP